MTLALTTLGHVKESLSVPDSSLDPYLTNLINRVSLGVEDYIGRGDLTSQVLTEGYDATGTETLILRRWPVTNVAQVTLDGVVVDPTTYLLIGGGRKGLLKRLGQQYSGQLSQPYANLRWAIGGDPERIQVTYTAGYPGPPTNPPYDLEQAAIECISIWKSRRLYGYPIQSEHLGQYGYNLDTSADQATTVLPISIMSLLSHYKDLEI